MQRHPDTGTARKAGLAWNHPCKPAFLMVPAFVFCQVLYEKTGSKKPPVCLAFYRCFNVATTYSERVPILNFGPQIPMPELI